MRNTSTIMSSDSTISLQQLESLLLCPVCLDRYNNPRILPCQHTFCRFPCLQGLINSQTRSIKCPECRSEHRIPPSGPDGFPSNITLSAFLDLHMQSSVVRNVTANDVESKICVICEQESETSQCFHCNKKLCSACKQAHLVQARNNAQRLANELKNGLPNITNVIQNVTQRIDELQTLSNNIKIEITNVFDTLATKLQERQNMLKNEVDAVLRGELLVMQTQQENLELDFASISSYCESLDTSQLSNTTSEEQLLNVRQQCSDYLAKIRRIISISMPSIIQLRFQHDESILHNALSSFGETVTGNTGHHSSTSEESMEQQRGQDFTNSERAWEEASRSLRSSRSVTTAVSHYTPSWSSSQNSQPSQPVNRNINSYMHHMSTNIDQAGEVVRQMRIATEQADRRSGTAREQRSLNRSQSLRNGDSSARLGFFGVYNTEDNTDLRRRQRRPHESDRFTSFIIGDEQPNVRRRMNVPPPTAFEVPLHNSEVRELRRESQSEQRENRLSSNPISSIMEESSTIQTPLASVSQNDNLNVITPTSSDINLISETTPSGSNYPMLSSTITSQLASNEDMSNGTIRLVRSETFYQSSDNNSTSADQNAIVVDASVQQQILPASINSSPVLNQRIDRINYSSKGDVVILLGQNRASGNDFKNPRGIAVSSSGDIIVTDSGNHRTQVFDNRGQFICSFGCFGTGDGQFNNPTGITSKTQGQIIVADGNGRLQLFNRSGQFCRTFGRKGSGNGEFNNPIGVCIDSTGNMFICDKANCCIQVLTRDGIFLRKFGGHQGQLKSPEYIAIKDNILYITDSKKNSVQIFTADGVFVRSIGKKGTQAGQLRQPTGIAVDNEGNVIVCDKGNQRVQIFDNNGNFMHLFGSRGDIPGQFKQPEGIAITSQGQIIVSDVENNCVQIF